MDGLSFKIKVSQFIIKPTESVHACVRESVCRVHLACRVWKHLPLNFKTALINGFNTDMKEKKT